MGGYDFCGIVFGAPVHDVFFHQFAEREFVVAFCRVDVFPLERVLECEVVEVG